MPLLQGGSRGFKSLCPYHLKRKFGKMAIILGKIKCCFCGKKHGLLYSVYGSGIYFSDIGKRYFYHPECLELVQLSPEKFGHRIMDLAVDICDKKKHCKETFNNKIIPNFEEKVKKLKTEHFNNMIPGR